MIKHDKKIDSLFNYWIITCLLLVISTILIGGLTRLTGSGLSITEWELFKGIIPPLSQNEWLEYFELYKKIPQYELVNKSMSLDEFKIIYYWEYAHRIIARFIGLFFLIPLLYFHFTKKIEKKYLLPCYFIFILILIQGIIGWFMVQSGLVNDITVSHYRLALHLLVALIITSSIFWLLINKLKNKNKLFFNFSKENMPFLLLILLIFIQIIFGAFVSGLDAGKIFQSWPLMGQSYFPNDLEIKNIKNLFDLNTHSLVQFYHRNLAYLITLYIVLLTFFNYLRERKISKPFIIVNLFLVFQIILGITTLISGLNIYLASAHQITSVLLIFSSINLYYSYIK